MAEATPDITGICDRCIGRRLIGAQGAEAQTVAGAEHRGDASATAEADCRTCEGVFEESATWIQLAVEALSVVEHATFQVGTVFPKALEQAEKALQLNPDIGDTMRTEANRLLGPAIAEATGKEWVTDGRPDAVVQVDTRFHHAEVTPNSLFVRGRYTKFRRDVPQTHWPCKRCQGTGCWECDDAGVLYTESVEQAIADVLVPAFDGAGASFHGAGREDIDALMLETGRPFVLEVHQPKRRTIDLDAAVAAINATTDERGTAIAGPLWVTEKDDVARIKNADYQKEYLAHCLTETPVTQEHVEAAAAAMSGVTLDQRTPQRVAHRRADLVRNRTVERITVETPPDSDETRFSIRVLAESGTYIKEMVSSDDGRTTPSFASTLGVPCKVEFLDVVAILDDESVAPQG